MTLFENILFENTLCETTLFETILPETVLPETILPVLPETILSGADSDFTLKIRVPQSENGENDV